MSCFSWDSPGLKALSRCPGQSIKKSWLGIQSASMAQREYYQTMIGLFSQIAEDWRVILFFLLSLC